MQFNSYGFILLFLPLSVIVYSLCRRRGSAKESRLLLTLISLLFYSFFGVKCLLVLLAGMAVNYFFIRLMERVQRKRLILILAVGLNVLLLFSCKYLNFFVSGILSLFGRESSLPDIFLPVGISFYTFQQISCLVLSYKGKISQQTLLDYGAFCLYFPKISMGPLIEPDAFYAQLNAPDDPGARSSAIAAGLQLFAIGLFKKVIMGDTFAAAVNWGFENFDAPGSLDWILVALCYTFQIYFDFSGYSDMAIGVSKMFGIELPVNFNSPYRAVSLRDFWKRWHITLTQFLTHYIYIPLGGSRKGRVRTCVNMLLVFLISGLWHGANWTFILWGLLNGLICVLERLWAEKHSQKTCGRGRQLLRWGLTFLLINVLWLLFRADSVEQWLSIFQRIADSGRWTVNPGLLDVFEVIELRILNRFLFSKILPLHFLPLFNMLVFLSAAFIMVLAPKNSCTRKYKMSVKSALGTAFLILWCLFSLSGAAVFIYSSF